MRLLHGLEGGIKSLLFGLSAKDRHKNTKHIVQLLCGHKNTKNNALLFVYIELRGIKVV